VKNGFGVVSSVAVGILLSLFCTKAMAGKLKFDPNIPLYTSDKVGHNIDNVATLLDTLTAGEKTVILFVHGRGKEPNKSLNGAKLIEGRAVHKIERQYGSPVLMFNWDSKGFLGDRTKPLSRMKKSAESLTSVLQAIVKYRESRESALDIVLLVQSMGSIVVQTVVEEHGWPAKRAIFKNVLFSASDSDAPSHAKWIDEIGKIENVFVTINYDDKALKWAKDARARGVLALGRDPGSELSPHVRYVDISGLGKNHDEPIKTHELFNKEAMEDQIHICKLFHETLSGNIQHDEENRPLYSINARTEVAFERDPENDCFQYD